MKAATELMPVTAAKQDMILLDEDVLGPLSHDLDRPLRVLLTKPFQFATPLSYSPPLGLLYLASALRHRFGDTIEVELLDMKVRHMEPEKVRDKLRDFQPDVIGVSALNCEAAASYELARICKEENEQVITVLGGPFALRLADTIYAESVFDWIFSGSSERTFTEAISRQFRGQALGDDLPGFSHRTSEYTHINTRQENITNLDEIPKPAWDLIDFPSYTKMQPFGGMLKEKRYALLFTSRGCPYLCNYCHDIFSKRFVYQSAESVVEDIAVLYEKHGVTEFQIVDDIFNLHKPRVEAIMNEVARRWPGIMRFTFPNGIRGDILDQQTIDALARAGTYYAAVAVETVTPRLQTMIQKNLNHEKTEWSINALEKAGISVAGFFMVGFPTETPEEIKATVDYALRSDMTLATFFTVTPQPETPLYETAKIENLAALKISSEAEKKGGNAYRDTSSWYEIATGFPLHKTVRHAHMKFYLSPKRIIGILKVWPLRSILRSMKGFIQILMPQKAVKAD